MSKQADLPERLRTAGATDLERRLLEAAGREQPSPELSARMAQAIGISFSAPAVIEGGAAKTGTATGAAANASSSLVPWVSGAVVAACVVAGAYLATRPSESPARVSAAIAPAQSASSTPAATALPAPETPTAEVAVTEPNASEESPGRALAPQRARRGTTAGELANQIALVDAARKALAAGDAQRALSSVREYQSEYPNGTFRPEVAAVRIEALIKMGRSTEARTLAERFVVAYGPGPLADRVARLAHLAER